MPYLPDKSLVLIGLMGAGKSTIGRRLARRLHLDFVDADAEVERATGLSIARIFERFGEDHFREHERNVIARLVEGPTRVIATGGGAFMDEGTRQLILEKCVAIWLDADIEILAERVGRRDHRPLFRDKDPATLLAELAERRKPVYASAHVTIHSGSLPHEMIVDRIVEALEARRR